MLPWPSLALANTHRCTAQHSTALTARFATTIGQSGASTNPSSTSPGTLLPNAAYLQPGQRASEQSAWACVLHQTEFGGNGSKLPGQQRHMASGLKARRPLLEKALPRMARRRVATPPTAPFFSYFLASPRCRHADIEDGCASHTHSNRLQGGMPAVGNSNKPHLQQASRSARRRLVVHSAATDAVRPVFPAHATLPWLQRRLLAFFMVLIAGGGWRSVSWISTST